MPETSLARRAETDDPAEPASVSQDPRGVDVGARLLKLRRSRGMTLQEISSATGVSASALSKIERNELSPTISTLQRIAHGLSIELVALLSVDEEGVVPSVSGRRSVSRAGRGSKHATGTCDNVLLCTELRNKRATPILTTVTARSPSDYSVWPKLNAEVFLMVVDGTLVLHSRLYEPLELERGDSVYYDANTEHVWTSKGPIDAEVLWVIVEL